MTATSDHLDSARGRTPLSIAIAASMIVAAVVPVVIMTKMYSLADNFPRWDQWHLVPMWSAYYEGRSVTPYLFAPYHRHLNIVPRLIFFGMGILTHWDVRVELILSFLFATGTLVTILLMLNEWDRRLLVLAAPVAAQVFSLSQFVNFHDGYGMGQNLSQFAGTLVVVLLTRRHLRRAHIAGAAIAALVATFSWGAGLATWGVGLACLAFRREWRRTALVWGALAFGAATVVFFGAGGAHMHLEFGPLLKFFIALFGKAAGVEAFPEPMASFVIGAAALIIFAILVATAAREGLFDRVYGLVMFSLLPLGSAGLIALGRFPVGMKLAATGSHYVTATYPLNVCILGLGTVLLFHAAATAGSSQDALAARVGIAVVIAAGFAQPIIVSTNTFSALRYWVATNRLDTWKVIEGDATDEEIRRSIYTKVDLVRSGTEVLRRHRLAFFKSAPPELLVPRVPNPSKAGAAAPRITDARALPQSAFQIEWGKVDISPVVVAGLPTRVSVSFTNTSTTLWPAKGNQKAAALFVRLSYRWVGAPYPWDQYGQRRIELPYDVRPGQSVTVVFDASVPPVPGDYEIQVDALQEMVSWFEGRGAPRSTTHVRVTAASSPSRAS